MTETRKATVANVHRDAAIIAQANAEGRYTYVGRPSKWGNWIELRAGGTPAERRAARAEVVRRYRAELAERPGLLRDIHELRGQVLGCWCRPAACHADVLAEMANALTEEGA